MNHHQIQLATDHHGTEPTDVGRRRFLKMAAVTGLTLPWGVASAHALGPEDFARRRQTNKPLWQFEAVRVEQTFSDGSTVPFFRYRPLGTSPRAGTVPLLSGHPGEIARVRVRNSLSRAIKPSIIGGASGPSIAPGAVATFDLAVPPEGTWLLTDEALGDAAGPMGLGAVIISRTTGPSFQRVRPNYNREYVLLYVDSDDRWNAAIDAGQKPNYNVYEPNYHTVNNLTFPATTTDPGTLISCQVGDRVLLRMCNLGWMRQAIHFHGYHVDIHRINNQRQSIYGPKDTIPLPGHTTTEVILPVNQPGLFPVHPHSLTTTTDNGLYIGGQVTLIAAT